MMMTLTALIALLGCFHGIFGMPVSWVEMTADKQLPIPLISPFRSLNLVNGQALGALGNAGSLTHSLTNGQPYYSLGQLGNGDTLTSTSFTDGIYNERPSLSPVAALLLNTNSRPGSPFLNSQTLGGNLLFQPSSPLLGQLGALSVLSPLAASNVGSALNKAQQLTAGLPLDASAPISPLAASNIDAALNTAQELTAGLPLDNSGGALSVISPSAASNVDAALNKAQQLTAGLPLDSSGPGALSVISPSAAADVVTALNNAEQLTAGLPVDSSGSGGAVALISPSASSNVEAALNKAHELSGGLPLNTSDGTGILEQSSVTKDGIASLTSNLESLNDSSLQSGSSGSVTVSDSSGTVTTAMARAE